MLSENLISALRNYLGLEPDVFHPHHVEYVWRKHMADLGFSQDNVFAEILLADKQAFSTFGDEIYTPATWFFRHNPAFHFLEYWLAEHWLPSNGKEAKLKVLSYPCASGEEAYSLMMTAVDAGLSADQVELTGCDTREHLLSKATQAQYTSASFSPHDARECERYFDPYGPEAFHIDESIRGQVDFITANPIIEGSGFRAKGPFDVIFCRNFLLYLKPEYRRTLIERFRGMLAENGLMFAGNSDNLPAIDGRFRLLGAKGSYAYTFDSKASPRPEVDDSVALPSMALPEDEVMYTREQTHRNACELAENGFFQEAEYICYEYLEKTGPSAEIFFLLGKIYDAEGQGEKSEAAFRKCVYLENGHPEAYDALATISEKRGHAEHAEQLRKRGTKPPFSIHE